ncbi:hypothetical protein CL617_05095 [archaeon]|nr:hypothetical protein [archaeon]|tara:strand:+ start:4037 stop:5368 length:1332 start_codon:yes stop_codon:yes gene_type:complete
MKKEVIILFIILFFPTVVSSLSINEIHYDPEGSDNNKEFVELYYDSWENLTNYIVRDSTSEDVLILAKLNTSSNYALIVEDGFNTLGINVTIYTIGATIGNNLNNGKDIVIIKNSSGTILDQVNYTNFPQVSSGFSLERLTINKNSTDNANFNQSLTQEGTPGRINPLTDNIEPNLTLIYPENNSFLNTQNINFTFTTIDNSNNLNCTFSLNNIFQINNRTTLNNTLTTFTINNINESKYNYNITCLDSQLNSNTKQRTFTIDTTKPNLTNLEETLTINSANINFNTNENSNFSSFFNNSTLTNENFSKNHSILFENLQDNTFYNHNITYCDQSNNCNLIQENFTTLSIIVSSSSSGEGSGSNSNSNDKITKEVESKIEKEISNNPSKLQDQELINNENLEPPLITGTPTIEIKPDFKIGMSISAGILVLGLSLFNLLGLFKK